MLCSGYKYCLGGRLGDGLAVAGSPKGCLRFSWQLLHRKTRRHRLAMLKKGSLTRAHSQGSGCDVFRSLSSELKRLYFSVLQAHKEIEFSVILIAVDGKMLGILLPLLFLE